MPWRSFALVCGCQCEGFFPDPACDSSEIVTDARIINPCREHSPRGDRV